MIHYAYILGVVRQLVFMLLFDHASDALIFGLLLSVVLAVKLILDNRFFIRKQLPEIKPKIFVPENISHRRPKDDPRQSAVLNRTGFMLKAGRVCLELKRI